VNLSVSNLLDEGFAEEVRCALSRHGASGSQLTFEITENLILTDPARAKRSVEALRALGARVSLDDYGTGYSSMAYLRQLPLDELKLDRSFVAALADDPASHVFVSTARQLATALGLSLVAEGIETRDVWDLVREIGCDRGQGYLFSRPLPVAELRRLLLARTRAVAVMPHT
jgi:diguanylate cyclase